MSFEPHPPTHAVMPEINMTPLVDVMLVLLIVFIVAMPAVQQAVKVALPQTSAAPQAPQPTPLQLAVARDGQFFLGTQPLALADLEAALRVHASHSPQPQLLLHGDQQVPYAHVVQAMAAAQRAGLQKIGFVTEAPATRWAK